MPVTETKLKKKIDLKNNNMSYIGKRKTKQVLTLYSTLERETGPSFFRKDFWDCY